MVKFGTYLVGASKVVIDENTSEKELGQIAKNFPALRKFIGYDNISKESDSDIKVVPKSAESKSKRGRKSTSK